MENLHLSFLLFASEHSSKIPLICLALRSVPDLKALRLQVPWSSNQWVDGHTSEELNKALVALLERDTIEELAVDGFFLLDHDSFYEALASNTSLKVLDIPFFVNSPNKRESLLQAIQTNRSLESLPCWNFRYSEESPVYLQVWYWIFLNRLGRKQVFDLDASKDTFVQLLDQAIRYNGDRLGHPDDALFQVQMAFGLLSERPSLWAE